MRSSHVFTLMTGVALIAACSGDGGNGPSNTAPTAAFTYECTNLTCAFTDQSADADGTIASRSWDFGDGNSGTGATANHTYASAGTYQVTVEATDDGGKSTTSAAQAVTVTAASATVQAAFDAVCTGLVCTLDNTSTATGTTTTFAWDFGDGQTSTDEDPAPVIYDVSSPTTFTITLVVTSDGVPSQATKQVRVSPAATLTCNGVDCALLLDQAATVVVTLQSEDCEVHGNTFVITAPAVDTLFTDGCFAPVSPAAGSSFTLNNGDAYAAGTQLSAEVLTGVAGADNPQLRVTGTFAAGWTLEFDDGFVGVGEPDFNDLVIKVVATPQ
jgi:PKD repeat protein